MSLSELRAELKSLRKSLTPVPTSRMKKADVATEIARLKGLPPKTEVEPPKPVESKKKADPKPDTKPTEVKKTKGVRGSSPLAGRKAAGAPAEVSVPTTTAKPAKGSEEMKARMAALRAKRAEKKAE